MMSASPMKLFVPFSGLALATSLTIGLGVAAAQPDLGPNLSKL
jgi:hypothetical protein